MGTSRRFQARNGLDNNSLTLIGVATPVNTTDAANKAYADTKLALTGGTLSGASNGATLELLRLSNTGTGANTKSRLNFYAASTNYGSITGGYGASAPEMVFDINTTAGSFIWNNNTATQMRLDSSGNLGIGVTPSAWSGYKPLQAGTGASFGGYAGDVLSFVGSNTYNDNTNWRYIVGGNAATRYQQSAGIHTWYTAPSGTAGNAISFTQAMTLDASGNLGIGTSSPAALLDVNGAGIVRGNFFVYSTGDRLNVFPQTAGSGVNIVSTNNANSAYAPLTLDGSVTIFNTNGSEQMRLTSTGLGIGTSSPSVNLDIRSADQTQTRVVASTNGVDMRLVATGSSSNTGYVGTVSNHPVVILTNNTERAKFTSAGVLQLSPTGGEGGEINLLNPTGGTIGGYLDVSVSDNLRLWTNNLNSSLQIGQLASTGGNIQLYTEGIERVRVTSTGTVGIGTSITSGAGLDIKNDAGGALLFAYGTTAAGGNISILGRNSNAGAGSATQVALWNDQNPFSGFGCAMLYFSSGSVVPNEMRLSQGTTSSMTFWINGIERERVTQDGNRIIYQPAQSAQNTSATLTIAQIRTQIITSTAAVTYTLPTGTTLDTYTTNMAVNTAFEVTFIASALGAITLSANGNTIVGRTSIDANTSGTYRFRKTAANTFTVYRI